MAIPRLLQSLVDTAKVSQTVVKKNTEKKANNALGQLVSTQQKTLPQTRAKELLPGLIKTAEVTGKIGQKNVSNKQAKAKELLSGMTDTVNKGFSKSKDTALVDLQSDVNAGMPKEELRNFYPDIPDTVVEDLYTDLQAGMPIEEAKKFYPEIYDLPNIGERKPNIVENTVGGLTKSVVGLPSMIAESGLLDKPVETLLKSKVSNYLSPELQLAKKVAGKFGITVPDTTVAGAIQGGAKALFGDKAVEQYRSKEGGKPFSDVAKNNFIGDVNSKEFKRGENIGDVIQSGVGIASGIKGLSKAYGKKVLAKDTEKILDIIAEPEKVKNMQKALEESRLVGGNTSKIKNFFFGEKGYKILPSKTTENAANIIKENILNTSKTPTGLYKQLTDFVSKKSIDLSSKLKNIPISNISDKDTLVNNLDELSKIGDEFTTSEMKKFKSVIDKVNKSSNLDDIWTVRKDFDDMFSDSIKNATDMSAPSTRKANRLRNTIRKQLNSSLDDISKSNIDDINLKKEFQDMSSILNAKGNIRSKLSTNLLKPKKGVVNFKNTAGALGTYAGYKLYNGLTE